MPEEKTILKIGDREVEIEPIQTNLDGEILVCSDCGAMFIGEFAKDAIFAHCCQ